MSNNENVVTEVKTNTLAVLFWFVSQKTGKGGRKKMRKLGLFYYAMLSDVPEQAFTQCPFIQLSPDYFTHGMLSTDTSQIVTITLTNQKYVRYIT